MVLNYSKKKQQSKVPSQRRAILLHKYLVNITKLCPLFTLYTDVTSEKEQVAFRSSQLRDQSLHITFTIVRFIETTFFT